MARKFSQAEWQNILSQNEYYHRLSLMAKNVFEWVNLPPTCSARYLEWCLFEFGRAVFVNSKDRGILSVQATPNGQLNVYNEPISILAQGMNGYHEIFDFDKVVYVRNNDEERATDITVRFYAAKLYEIDRTIDVNIRAQKTPITILCDEKERLSYENAMKQYDGNEPFIMGQKNGFSLEAIKAIRTDAPFVADKLFNLKQSVWSEAMTCLGIDNTSITKKERLVTDEVESNDEQIFLNAELMLQTRKMACKKFNELFNPKTPLDVRFRSVENTEPKEGIENE